MAAYSSRTSRLVDIAFSEGSDARLAGTSPLDNPYKFSDNCHHAFAEGWQHINDYWGIDVQGRWEVKPLPRVSEY